MALRVAPLAFVVLAAYLASRTVNVILESELLTLAEFEDRAPLPAPPPRGLDLDAVTRTFGFPDGKKAPPASEPARSALPLKLLGTLISDSRPDWSVASIQDLTTHRTSTRMHGDLVLGVAEIISIERGRVVVLHAGRREFIDVAAKTSEITTRTSTSLPRAALSDLATLSTQARIIPAFKDGAVIGFKIFSIQPNSLYAQLGAQNGDVIKRINGFELNSLERGLELLTRLRETSRVEVELERAGASLLKTFSLD